MPHQFGGGFYTTQDVPLKPDTNHTHSGKVTPQISHGGGQNTDNTKTEANDANKQ